MPDLTTTQIATLCERSERQVQRWIAEGKLKAAHIQGNIYSIEEDALNPFLPPLPREVAQPDG
jgi:excisionase family DNA binding protein